MEAANQRPSRHALGKRTRNDPEALSSRNTRSYASEIAFYPVGLVITRMNCFVSVAMYITDVWLTRSLFRPLSLHGHHPRDPPLKDLIIRGPRLRGSVLMELVVNSMSLVEYLVLSNSMAHQGMNRSLLARPHCPISSITISLWAV